MEKTAEGAVSPETQRFYSALTSSLTDPAILGIQPSALCTQRTQHGAWR